MPKLGKRERRARRERLLREKRDTFVNREVLRVSSFQEALKGLHLTVASCGVAKGRCGTGKQGKGKLATGGLVWTGSARSRQGGGLSADNLKSLTHYTGAYVGRSPGSMPPERAPMPERFKTSFMAPGHDTEELRSPPPDKRLMVKVGEQDNSKRTPIYREVGRPDAIPKQ